jgi:hypothetical protein
VNTYPLSRLLTGGALAAGFALSACTVNFWDYPRIEATDAEYIHVGCQGDGPPKRTYYAFHGVFIAVELEPLLLTLTVPRRVEAAFDAEPVTVSGQGKQGAVQLTLPLRLTDQQILPGSGSTAYNFESQTGVRPGQPNPDAATGRILQGTLHLPGITINGNHFPGQDRSITRPPWRGMTPTATPNCTAVR